MTFRLARMCPRILALTLVLLALPLGFSVAAALGSKRPWLMTPDQPEAFVRALTGERQ